MTDTTTRAPAPEWDPSKPLGTASSSSGEDGERAYTHPTPGAYIAELITVREVPKEQWPIKTEMGTRTPKLDKDGNTVFVPKVRLIWRMLRDEDNEECADDMTLGQKVTLSMFRTAKLNKIAAAIYRIDFIPDGTAITPAMLTGYQAWVDVKEFDRDDGTKGVYIAGVRPLTGKRAANTPAPILEDADGAFAF